MSKYIYDSSTNKVILVSVIDNTPITASCLSEDVDKSDDSKDKIPYNLEEVKSNLELMKVNKAYRLLMNNRNARMSANLDDKNKIKKNNTYYSIFIL